MTLAEATFWMDAFLSWLPPWLTFLGICLGHGFLWLLSLNVLYAFSMKRQLQKCFRLAGFALILAGPIFFWFLLFQDFTASGYSRSLWASYLSVCLVTGLIGVPLAQGMYWFRRPPAVLVSNQTQTIHVDKALGYKPIGLGKNRALARLPFNEVFQVDFLERTFALPQIPPAWDGLSILHLSDLHLSGTPDRDYYNFILDRCLEEGIPDLVAITGDIVDSRWHHRWIVPVLGRLRWKCAAFAILGNHDAWRDTKVIRRRLRKIRLEVLANTWKQIEVRGHPMLVIGHEGPWFQPEPDLRACPSPLSLPVGQAASLPFAMGTLPYTMGKLAACPTGGVEGERVFRLCLSHTPDNIVWARKNAIDLMLAGHVHGGQIRLPLIGSLFVPSRFSRKYDCGSFFEPPTLLHVSRGLSGQEPLRYNCRPEVTRIILRKE